MDRRSFLFGAAASVAAAAASGASKAAFRIGVTDWNLRMTGKTESIELAKSLGFEGVQISIGRAGANGKLALDDDGRIAAFKAEAARLGFPINSTCLDVLHANCLKNDALAEKWVADGIRITAAVGTKVLLLPFFGKCEMKSREEVDRVGDVLAKSAPAAEKAGVILAVENTVSGPDNLRILERAKSKAVQIYYDVGNSTNGGFDILREIRELGAERICQVHLKDNPYYLGEGRINFGSVIRALVDIRYAGFANLETDCPSGDVRSDMARNLKYVRGLIA